MTTVVKHLTLDRKDGSSVDRYVKITERRDSRTHERSIELMTTPQTSFDPERQDTGYQGCGVKTAQNFGRWFDINYSQSHLRRHYIETTDMEKYIDLPGGDAKTFTTPAELEKGLRELLDTRFDRRYKMVRHTGASKSSTLAKIEHYLLHGFPPVALAKNGNHWVTIAGMKLVYNATDGSLSDVTFTVFDNGSEAEWSWSKLHFWFSDGKDVLAAAARLAGYTSYIQGTLIGCRYDMPQKEYDWSSGWSNAEFFSTKEGQFLFLLKEGNGTVHIHRMESNGSVGSSVAEYDWSGGWSTVKLFSTSAGLFLFLMKKRNGTVHIHRMNDNGAVGSSVAEYDWSDGWSSAEFFSTKEGLFLFLLKEGNGIVHIHRMNSNGTLGASVGKHDWSSGWSTVKLFSTNAGVFLFLLKEGNGMVHIHRMNDNGTVGSQIAGYDWTSGWGSCEFYSAGGKNLMLIHKSGGKHGLLGDADGLARLHEINDNGTVGAMVDDAYWMSRHAAIIHFSWPVLRVFSPVSGGHYLFQLRPTDGKVEIHRLTHEGLLPSCFVD